MGWLVGYTIASLVAAFIIVKLFDYVVQGASGSIVVAARYGLFVLAWTVITARGGMNVFSRKVRQIRRVIPLP